MRRGLEQFSKDFGGEEPRFISFAAELDWASESNKYRMYY
jgi:hypothetical protein